MANILQGEQLVAKAAELAEEYHEGQTHFFGDRSYFEMHLKPVAENIRRWGHGPQHQAAGYLHDAFEDTELTAAVMSENGIPDSVIIAVKALTKVKGQEHSAYLEQVASNTIARPVKMADSSFNFSWTTLNSPAITDKQFTDWSMGYMGNLAYLM